MWDAYKKGFKAYLQLEKSLSDNSTEAYLHDIEKLTIYLQETVPAGRQERSLKTPSEIKLKDLQQFIKWITELGRQLLHRQGSYPASVHFISTVHWRIFQRPTPLPCSKRQN